MKRLLLHICCGPCACYPLRVLADEGIEVEGYWYNHNIHPYTEYRRRLESLLYLASKKKLKLHIDDQYDLPLFITNLRENIEFPNRCDSCYSERLERTAQKAVSLGIPAFSTTLLYSRYQKHSVIVELGQKIALRHGIEFLYRDFRKGWREGIEMSKDIGLYRQQYCGCILSEMDRYMPKD